MRQKEMLRARFSSAKQFSKTGKHFSGARSVNYFMNELGLLPQ